MADDLLNGSLIAMALGLWQRRKWLLIISFLLSFGLVASLVKALPPLYRSSTTILVGQEDISESLVKAKVKNELELRLGIIQQDVLSRKQLQEIIDKYDLYSALREQGPPEMVIERLRKDIGIEQRASRKPQWGQETTYSVTISYQAWDPELAASVANDLAARFKAENERIRTEQASKTTAFLKDELDAAKTEFFKQERRLNDFRNKNMGSLPEQQQTNMAALERLNSQLRLNERRQTQLFSQFGAPLYGRSASEERESLVGITGSLRLERLKQELAELRTRYTDNFPGIIHLEHEIRILEKELSEERSATRDGKDNLSIGGTSADMDSELAALRREEEKLHSKIASVMRRIDSTPRVDQQLKRFVYDYESAKDEYSSLQKLYQDAQRAQSLETQKNQQFKIIEVAIPPAFPVAPQRSRLFFIGFVLAVGFAGAVLFFTEQKDQGFYSVTDIRGFSNLPVLANISHIQTAEEKVNSAHRVGFISVMVVAGLVLVTSVGYYVGKGAEQLVWAIAG